MYYVLSIGTNQNPKINAVNIVKHLCNHFGCIKLYPFIETPPVNMDTQHQFLNSVCIIDTDLSANDLKHITNEIEITLGRKRSDPRSAYKDRPADIDIMQSFADYSQIVKIMTDEPYINEVLKLNKVKMLDLSQYGLPSFTQNTAVCFDAATDTLLIDTDEIQDIFTAQISAS